MTLTTTTMPPLITAPDDWPPLRVVPADPAQHVFRACLTALSRPGTVTRLPHGCVPEQVPAVVAPLLALTDLMAPLCAVDSDVPGAGRAVELVAAVTGTTVTEPGRARFALTFGESAHLGELCVGSHWSPELGALLCQRVGALSDTEHDAEQDAAGSVLRLRVSGPGVKSSADLTVAGLTPHFVQLRAALAADFPSGVDVLLITDDGDVAGLPRTSRIEVR